jgi:ArsR family transcriptional regulator
VAVASSSTQTAQIFGALADSTRFAILHRLRSGERRVGELCKETELAQSLISFHLKALRESGLLRSRREGRTIWYSLDPAGLAQLRRLVESLGSEEPDDAEAVRAADLKLCLKYINGR